jgi:hypothetical protein
VLIDVMFIARIGCSLDAPRTWVLFFLAREEVIATVADLPRCASCRVSIEPSHNVVFRVDGRIQHVACPEVLCPVCSGPIMPDDPIRRDGEATLHGHCWTRRKGAATNAPVNMMPEPDRMTDDRRASEAAAPRCGCSSASLPTISATCYVGSCSPSPFRTGR